MSVRVSTVRLARLQLHLLSAGIGALSGSPMYDYHAESAHTPACTMDTTIMANILMMAINIFIIKYINHPN